MLFNFHGAVEKSVGDVHDKINETRKRKLPIISWKKVKRLAPRFTSSRPPVPMARACSPHTLHASIRVYITHTSLFFSLPLDGSRAKGKKSFNTPRRVTFEFGISSWLSRRLVGRCSYLKRGSNQRLGYRELRRPGTIRMRRRQSVSMSAAVMVTRASRTVRKRREREANDAKGEE